MPSVRICRHLDRALQAPLRAPRCTYPPFVTLRHLVFRHDGLTDATAVFVGPVGFEQWFPMEEYMHGL